MLTARVFAAGAAIDGNVTNQSIRGFGASSAWNSQATLAPAAAVLFANDNLDGHAGLSILRTRIDPTGSFAAEAGPMTLAKGQNPNILIWSTMWTPPAAYKNNNSVNGPGATNTFNNTPANSTAYANYLVNYIKTIKANYGVDLYCVSPQNEPDWNTSYESCIWTAAQFNDFVRNYLGPAIQSNSLPTKIMIPESFSDNLAMAATAMNDPVTAPMISVIGNHLYGGGPRPLSAGGFSQLTTQESWETEMSDVTGAPHDPGMPAALQIAGWIHSCMVTASMNAYLHWWIYSFNGSNEGLYGADTTTPTKKVYVLGNFSKFVRPGWYRMGGTINSGVTGLNISAYKDKAGTAGSFAIVAINTTGAAVNEAFNLSNLAGSSAVPWVTDASNNLVHKAAVSIVGNSFSYSLPAQSVVTFLCTGPAGTPTFTPTYAGSPTRTPTPSPTPQSQLFDDFEDLNSSDNWGGTWSTFQGSGSSISITVAGPGAPGSAAGRLAANGTVADYAGVTGSFSGSPRDLSAYVGIRFKVKGSGTYWFQAPQANIADGDNFGASFTATGTWTTVTLPFSAFTQRGFGAVSTFDPTQIQFFQWASSANGALNFELDDVELLTYSLPTATPSRTRTATPSASVTPSRSATPSSTSTKTSSPTLTPINTPSNSPSSTSSRTPTGTLTATPTRTALATPSSSPTSSVTGVPASPSPTSTSSETRTGTPSRTPTATPSATCSSTATRTAPISATPTETLQVTATPSPTDIQSRTATSTRTSGPSSTASATPSITGSPTLVQSATATSTLTALPTGSATATVTPSTVASATKSSTSTATGTQTALSSATPSVTLTVSPTATGSATASVTALSTASITASATRSVTAQASASSSPTPSSTHTLTPLPSAASTANPTHTSTSTVTPVPSVDPTSVSDPNAPLQVLAAAAVPNPNPSAIAVQLSGPADDIAVKIYSSAHTLLFEADSGSTAGGWSSVELPPLTWLPNGLYYFTVTAWRGGKTSPPFSVGRFFLAR